MCNYADAHDHRQPHSLAREGRAPARSQNDNSGLDRTSRRDFLRVLMGGALAGASVLELAYHRAAWARAAAPADDVDLFDIQKAAEGVYFAHARPQTVINCNAAIFVRSQDVVVVDAHSKPSAAALIVRQIRREVTDKPVRYVINTHFHWDHTQGDHAYAMTGSKVDFIASSMTKHLMEEFAVARMKASRDAVPGRSSQCANALSARRPMRRRLFAPSRSASCRLTGRISRTITSNCRRSHLTSRT